MRCWLHVCVRACMIPLPWTGCALLRLKCQLLRDWSARGYCVEQSQSDRNHSYISTIALMILTPETEKIRETERQSDWKWGETECTGSMCQWWFPRGSTDCYTDHLGKMCAKNSFKIIIIKIILISNYGNN